MKLNLFIYVWLIAWVGAILLSAGTKKQKKQPPPELENVIVSGFAVGSAIALAKVLYKLLTDAGLQNSLDFDGSIALLISSALGIYFSLKELRKLF